MSRIVGGRLGGGVDVRRVAPGALRTWSLTGLRSTVTYVHCVHNVHRGSGDERNQGTNRH
jgi:hypothetical protein